MTEQNKKNERPDAVPASLSVGAVEPKYKKGDHVWAKQPKELAGRTGYVRVVDTYRMVYEVAFGTEVWKILEDDLELVDQSLEEARQPVFEREDEADQPLTELDNLGNEKPSAVERIAENMKQLGKVISQMGVKASDLDGRTVQTPPKPIGYLEHEESKTRIPVFKRIGWFHRCMLRWCFGVKYTKED